MLNDKHSYLDLKTAEFDSIALALLHNDWISTFINQLVDFSA